MIVPGLKFPARGGVLYSGKLFFPRRNSGRRFDRRSSRHQSMQVTSGMSSSPLPGGNRLIFLDHSILFTGTAARFFVRRDQCHGHPVGCRAGFAIPESDAGCAAPGFAGQHGPRVDQ